MRRILLALGMLLGLIAPAAAQTTGILVVSTCGNQTFNVGATTAPLTVDATGALCGLAKSAGGSIGNVGGFDSGPISATAAPANSSHAAGTSIGGLFTIPLARIAGGSGLVTNQLWKSTGGSTGSLLIRIWQKNPTGTTCTDNVAFAGSDTDDVNLITPPYSIVPSAPVSTVGDTATYASNQGTTLDYKNADTVPSQNLYLCVVTVATDTADQNKLVRMTLSGPQN